MDDTPDPSNEEPSSEKLANSKDQSEGVEFTRVDAGRYHGSYSRGEWNTVEDKAQESHVLVDLDDGLLASVFSVV